MDNGLLTVNGLFGISGQVSYYSNSGPVPDIAMTLSGSGDPNVAQTDMSGAFALTDIPVGSYHLKPTKANDVNEITTRGLPIE